MAGRRYSEPGDRILGRDPVSVRRYAWFTRLNHWFTATTLIMLALSGFALFDPSLYWLSSLFGGGQATRWVHPFIGIALFVSFMILFVQLVRHNLFRREDAIWARNIGAVVKGDEDRLPELGKYNLGQKFVFWAMFWLIVVLIVTGFMIWHQIFPDDVPVDVRRIALIVHAIAAVLTILTLILHVFAAIWARGTLSAMTIGTVTGGWAFRHHRKWLRELAGRQRTDPAE